MQLQDIRYAGQRLIDSYGDGGFRLTDGRHEGSVVLLPHKVLAFDAAVPEDITLDSLAPFFEQADELEILLIGTGEKQVFLAPELRRALMNAGLTPDVMDSRAASRTFNILVSEERRVAAAIIAV